MIRFIISMLLCDTSLFYGALWKNKIGRLWLWFMLNDVQDYCKVVFPMSLGVYES